MRHDRPIMPPRWRFIAPALVAGARLRGEPTAAVSDVGVFLPRGTRRRRRHR